jgi:hypothetical protein
MKSLLVLQERLLPDRFFPADVHSCAEGMQENECLES